MRLIDADTLIEALERLIKAEGNIDYKNWDFANSYKQERINQTEACIDVVRYAPSIDAVEVVRGEWMPNPKIGWGETWVCSICGEKTTSSVMGKPRYKYCPMCGAKMKGADDE